MVSFPASEVHTPASLDLPTSSERTSIDTREYIRAYFDGAFATPSIRSLQSVSGLKRLRDSASDDTYVGYDGTCDTPKSYDTAERDRMRPRFITRLEFSPSSNDSRTRSVTENVEMAEVEDLVDAFQVLMKAQQVQQEGVICESCLTREPRSTARCSHCDRSTCIRCICRCDSCGFDFCSKCSMINYDERHDRIFCITCNLEQ